jgi:hypothetical protein
MVVPAPGRDDLLYPPSYGIVRSGYTHLGPAHSCERFLFRPLSGSAWLFES